MFCDHVHDTEPECLLRDRYGAVLCPDCAVVCAECGRVCWVGHVNEDGECDECMVKQKQSKGNNTGNE